VRLQGTILAPNAAVEFNNGQINGSLYAASVDGDGAPVYFVCFLFIAD
jgi:choice-of-anchor A domain-containing protein